VATQDIEIIEKPDRSCDLVVPPGHAIWWPEMVFMSVYNVWYRMKIDQEDGGLYVVLDKNGNKRYLSHRLNEEYNKWLYETFESKFLGENNE
jgi:hypothetical protein